MQPTNDKTRIVVDLGNDRYRPNKSKFEKNVIIQGRVYDEAKKMFLQTRSLSTLDLKNKLNCTYEQSLAIMDLLKQELITNNILLNIK